MMSKIIDGISGEVEYTYDAAERCYECRGYGDDYYEDENGELVCACVDCPFNPSNQED